MIHSRPEIIHSRPDMIHTHQTAPTQFVEANACRLNELGRRGLMRVVIHKKSPGIADEDVQPVAND